MATALRVGRLMVIPAVELVPGDVVEITGVFATLSSTAYYYTSASRHGSMNDMFPARISS